MLRLKKGVVTPQEKPRSVRQSPQDENVPPSPVGVVKTTTPEKNVTFYSWDTPGKTKEKKRRSLKGVSHPSLKKDKLQPQCTPLSQQVANENMRRDEMIGDAYAQRRDALEAAHLLFHFTFERPGALGFKILLARGKRSTRRRVIVDETFEYCEAFAKLRPNDELIAIDGDLLIEIDPEAFGELVKRLRSIRPLTLTFAMGEDREEAFRRQNQSRAAEATFLQERIHTKAPIDLAGTSPPDDHSTMHLTSISNHSEDNRTDFFLYSVCSACACHTLFFGADTSEHIHQDSSSITRGSVSARYIVPELLQGDDDGQYYYIPENSF